MFSIVYENLLNKYPWILSALQAAFFVHNHFCLLITFQKTFDYLVGKHAQPDFLAISP